ncbi:zinc finger protein DZIP1L isoform X2 [Camelus ferus]|uniref:Zinc finger protein DZIP1L isoform X2 n=1 Tax=Camelus ferus TaxID=419612 RepID=A0A8B8TN89_CAMFR|nr:zinc finger protein DZIP1L isoform X2 [Camelus ferus]
MQSPATTAAVLSGPLLGAHPLPAFKFQPRCQSMDWMRISALDVDRVAREMDVAALQENITSITFCNLDKEVCHRCRQPVDPALLKVLRLAQLSIEYLLHCQDSLSASVAELEAQLLASLGQQERSQQELARQADELKGVRQESHRRRKMIITLQQLLLQMDAYSCHMCHLCHKMFMNATYLQSHIQRRHSGMVEGGWPTTLCTVPTEKQKKQEQPVEEVLEELRAKLKWTEGKLEAQREAKRQQQFQEAEMTHQREKQLDKWKEKEQAKLYGEIDELKKFFWDKLKNVADQSSTLEEKLQALQSHNVGKSNLGSLQSDESEQRLGQAQELQALKERMEIQETEWKRKMKAIREEHAAQKRELKEHYEKLLASLSENQKKAQAQHQMSALQPQLQEQATLIASQEKMIQTMSLRKAKRIHMVSKAVDTEEDSSKEELQGMQRRSEKNRLSWESLGGGAPRKDQRALLAQPGCDVRIPERPTELRDSCSGQQKVPAAPRQKSILQKQLSPVLEDTLQEKLETMGIKRDAKGIPAQTFRHVDSLLQTQRKQKVGKFSEFLNLRKKLIQKATSRLKERQRNEAPVSQPDSEAPVKSQESPLVTKKAQPEVSTLRVASKPAEPPVTPPGRPTPAPRSRPSGTLAAPGSRLSTPPFSSEEDSEGDSRPRGSLPPPRHPSRMRPWPQDDWDWSDTETSKGSTHSSGTLVQSLVKNLEKQLEAPAKKPAGGVSLFLMPGAGPQRDAAPGGKPQLSEDDSDLEISSLEDLPQDLNQREKPKPLSKLPEEFGASSWSPGQPRVPGW